jgi:hypothetical protein
MCTRISLFVPSSANLDALESWAGKCGVGIEPVPGPEGQCRGTSILVTRSYCDCGTPIGKMLGSGRLHDPERSARQLRERGWSEAKIARSLAQKSEATSRRDARRRATALAGLREWVAFLRGAPTHGQMGSIGIFLADDGRWLSETDLMYRPRETSPLTAVDAEVLVQLRFGFLYQFQAHK